MARIRLLTVWQIASFTTLHILNLITPLTPTRHATHHPTTVNIRRVDLNTSALRPVLQALADDASVVLEVNDDVASVDGEEQQLARDLWVKVSPPVYIRCHPASSTLAQHRSTSSNSFTRRRQQSSTSFTLERRRKTAWEVVESFMSSWTRLVGDPVLSKWIVVLLAISISLNGFLLKGIALGLPVIGRSGAKGGVRFEEEEEEKKGEVVLKEKEETLKARTSSSDASVTPTALSPAATLISTTPAPPPPLFVPVPKAAVAPINFTIEDVDRKLQAAAASLHTPPLSDSGVHTPPHDTIRTLEECIDVFENGPRPLSSSMKMLNDEEVILLAQNGKIAMYALEKVLGMDQLERAVRIRRALVCKFLSSFFFCDLVIDEYCSSAI